MIEEKSSSKIEKNIDFETLKLLYVENSNMIHEIYKWREKVIVRFLVTIGSLCVLGAWLFTNSPELLFLPFIISLIISTLSGFMDLTNGKYFEKCYLLGKKYETSLKIDGVYTIFSDYYNKPKNQFTFTRILSIIYFGTAIISIIGLILVLLNI